MISGYGSALPLHDQWDAEAATVLKPWLENSLRWSDLFLPHNEHRMVLSRLLALGLFQMNGQWDALLETTVNAVLTGLYALGIAFGLVRILGSEYRVPVLLAVTAWLTLPFAHENTLWGFHAFHFLLFFSFVAIWGLGFFPAFSWNWWTGAIASVLACFSTASGFFASGVIILLEAMRFFSKRRRLTEIAPTCFLAIAIVALGLSLRVTFLPHEPLKAASAGAWVSAFAAALAWPYSAIPLLMVVLYLPWAVSTFLLVRTNALVSRSGIEMLFGMGVWVILQAAAIAYARGENGHVPIAPRYQDIVALGVVINALCVLHLLRTVPWHGPLRRTIAFVLGGVWIVGSLTGASELGLHKVLSGAGKEALLPMEENVRAYVATHDRKYLAGDKPYPDAERLANLLDDPSIRRILPTVIRPAVPVALGQESGDAFVANGYPPALATPEYEKAWGSYSQLAKAARGSMETATFHSGLPYLQFEVAGAVRGGTSLSLRDETGKEVKVDSRWPNENWRSAVVSVPGDQLRIKARDDSTTKWLAFREPRELGRLGYYAQVAVANGKYIFIISVALFGLMILNTLRGSSHCEQPLR